MSWVIIKVIPLIGQEKKIFANIFCSIWNNFSQQIFFFISGKSFVRKRFEFRGITILEWLESARFFYKSDFPALFSVQKRLQKSAEKFIFFLNRADTSSSNIVFTLVCGKEKKPLKLHLRLSGSCTFMPL